MRIKLFNQDNENSKKIILIKYHNHNINIYFKEKCMQIKVIKVTQDGKVGYLHSPTIFGGMGFSSQSPIVDNPWEAKNYALEENAPDLEQDISYLRLPNKDHSAMSGISVDTAHIVEIELSFKEVSIKEAYTENNKPSINKMKF